MSRRLAPTDRTVLAIAAGASLLLIVGAIAITRNRTTHPNAPSSYSAASEGGKAVYLLLESLGYRVERWERPPIELPAGAGVTLVLAEPEGLPTGDERAAVDRFLRGGGRLIATGVAGARFLPERRAVPDPIAGLTWARISARPRSAITEAAPAITLAPRAYWAKDAAVIPLYGTDERGRVIASSVGRGVVFWWASPTPLTNAGAREPGNLEFVLASLGVPGRRVLWDEYFHGHRRTAPRLRLAAEWQWGAWHLALAAAAVLLTYSRRSGPIVMPAIDRRLSPLEFVRALGALYERAGAAATAVDAAYERFRHQAARRLGIASSGSIDELLDALRDRRGFDDPDFERLLRACEASRRDPHLRPRTALDLTRSLSDYAAKLSLFPPSEKEIV